MISATEPSSADMSNASAFSYAQAAKGQGTTPTNPPSATAASQPPTSQSASPATKPAAPVEAPTETTDLNASSDTRTSTVEKPDIDSTQGPDADVQPEQVPEKQRSDAKQAEETGRLDRPWRRNDKGTRSSSTATRSVDDQDSKKTRKGKKTRAADKQAGEQASATDKESVPEEEVPKIELSEAPIPSVNFWTQRKEAHQAKGQPLPTASQDEAGSKVSAPADDAKKPLNAAEAASSTVAPKDAPATNGTKPHRKSADAVRADRNGSRGSRVTEKDSKAGAPPSVQDAFAWPTPETAIKEDKKKPITDKAERSEKEAQDDAQSKPRHKEKWVTYDYVPSVSFETQLPQLRNSKPRGGARGANGSRAATSSQAGDKLSAPAPSAKLNESRDRPRESSRGANRTTSLPPAAKRASMDAPATREQRKPSGHSNADRAKDSTPNASTEQGHTVRDRAEGRGERGRGGYRGRGGHHPVNSHAQHHGAPGFTATGPMPPRPQGLYSPPPRQGAHGQAFMPPPQRGGRGRGNANGNYHRMSLPNGAASRPPPVQTQFGPYDYPMAPMSAVPFQPQPYWDNVVLSLLKNQIEYYFSIENLCKDVFLRKRMDSQGFVHLHFIAAFKRIQDLSVDMGMIRAVCEASNEIDFVVGEDDIERVRRRSGWESFIMPMEDRDTFAQNDGPAHITNKSRGYHFGHQFNGMSAAPYAMSPPASYGSHSEPFQPLGADSAAGHAVNGHVNGNVNGHGTTSQLSAAVPDFSPSGAVGAGESGRTKTDAAKDNGSSANAMPNGVQAGSDASSHQTAMS